MRYIIPVAAAVAALLPLTSEAALVNLKIKVENIAPTNSVAFAALHLGLHSGVFDAFNLGDVAGDTITPIAEAGNGTAWLSAFELADPSAVLGSIRPTPAGPLLPGASAYASFTIDTDVNRYFTFASMVVPSNDFFIGNDSPTEYLLFDMDGNLQISGITQYAHQVWDAGSEVFDVGAAAFIAGSTTALRADQNSVVAFNFAELAAFNGLTTAAGYVFDSQLAANSAIYRISFEASPVPVPAALPLLLGGLGLLGATVRKRA